MTLFRYFSFTKKKSNQKKSARVPQPSQARVALRFSQQAGPVKLASLKQSQNLIRLLL
jgi:hypothetical protein